MSYTVLDTDVASRILKQQLPGRLTARLSGTPLCITFVTLAELTQWAVLRRWGDARRSALNRWTDQMIVLPGSDDVARRWGQISAHARSSGNPRPQNDTWIAACCLVYNLPLASINAADYTHFVAHQGLEVIDS